MLHIICSQHQVFKSLTKYICIYISMEEAIWHSSSAAPDILDVTSLCGCERGLTVVSDTVGRNRMGGQVRWALMVTDNRPVDGVLSGPVEPNTQ
jgi:hypothetical protein